MACHCAPGMIARPPALPPGPIHAPCMLDQPCCIALLSHAALRSPPPPHVMSLAASAGGPAQHRSLAEKHELAGLLGAGKVRDATFGE